MKYLIYKINSCDDCPESRFERVFDTDCCECGLNPTPTNEDPYEQCFLKDDCEIRADIINVLKKNRDTDVEVLANLLINEVLDLNICTAWSE